MNIYLDNNSGAPMRPEARDAMLRFIESGAANPSSVHISGQSARRALEGARAQVARSMAADPRRLVFTSGGTESNNLAIFGTLKAHPHRRRIVTSSIEHSSILAPTAELETQGYNVERIAPDASGLIDPDRIASAIDRDTAIVSLGLANSETGAIQNLESVGARARECGAIFHIDAAQALGRMRLDVASMGCDLMTLSGHKIGAPAGIGALYVRDASIIAPAALGGPQEAGLRAGTQNVAGAVAFGAAAEIVNDHLDEEIAQQRDLSALMLRSLLDSIPGLRLNGPVDRRIANTLNITFPGVLGETMLLALDLEGVRVSMGSACAAGAVEPSHVLLAMGLTRAEARSSLRISLGWANTRDEIESAASIIARVWRRLAETPSTRASAEVAR
ncbi:MAG TPA: cysteine desulfurase family protein [Candidatus Binataceae bacterium]|nr:cysteine desulfurase family protein [Candidatus Binataceae bacterium]